MQMSRMNHPRVPVPPVRRYHFISLFIQNNSPFLITQQILHKQLAFTIFGRWRNIPSNQLSVYCFHLPNMISIRRSRLAVYIKLFTGGQERKWLSHPSEDKIVQFLTKTEQKEWKNRAFSLIWLASMLIYWNKRKFYVRKEFNSRRVVLVHQDGCRFIVLQHQYGCHDIM